MIDNKFQDAAAKKRIEEEEEEDPRAEAWLLEYKMYKCMTYELRDRQMDAEQVFLRNLRFHRRLHYEEPVDFAELVGDI